MVTQLVEYLTVNQVVDGSTPSHRALPVWRNRRRIPLKRGRSTAWGFKSPHGHNYFMIKKKIFEQSLHDENDAPAREAVKRLYANIGYKLIDNPDKYGIDLIDKEGILSVEVERRLVWNSKEFPFNEVNFLQRKEKFFNISRSKITEYAIVSADFKRAGIIDKKTLMAFIDLTSPEESPNKYVNDSEYFYKIPKAKFVWLDII